MKGLLIKEINMYDNKFWLFFEIFLTVISYLGVLAGSDNKVLTFRALFINLIALVNLSSETENKHDKYFGCMPYDRFQFVLAKYIIVFSVPCILLIMDFCFLGSQVSFYALVISLPLTISLPLYYWHGGKKGASNSIGFVILSTAFLMVVKYLFGEYTEASFIFNEGVAILFVILALLCICSFLLSVHLFKKRDI